MNNFDLTIVCARYVDSRLSGVDKAVLCAIAARHNEEKGYAFPSVHDLEAMSCCNRKTVMVSVKRLQAFGIVSVERSVGIGNKYRVLIASTRPEDGTRPINGTGPINGTSPINGMGAVPETVRDPSQIGDTKNIEKHKKPSTTNDTALKADALLVIDALGESARPSKPSNDRGTRFTLTQLPDAWREWALEHAPGLDVDTCFEEFKDYWSSVPGARGRKKDWFATWRNHIRTMPTWKLERLSHASAQPQKADRLIFGTVSAKYANFLGSKLAETQDTRLSTYSRGCVTWRDVGDRIAEVLTGDDEGRFNDVKRLLEANKLI